MVVACVVADHNGSPRTSRAGTVGLIEERRAGGAFELIPGFDEVDSAPEALTILGDVAGVASDLMSLFSTVSFSTTEHTSVEQFGVQVNNGEAHDNLEATFYAASTAEQLTIGSNSYYPDMPLLYVDAT